MSFCALCGEHSPVRRWVRRSGGGYVKKSGERGAKKHTPSGALLLVPLTQRDKVDEYLNLKLSPPSFPFSVFPFPFVSPYFVPLS